MIDSKLNNKGLITLNRDRNAAWWRKVTFLLFFILAFAGTALHAQVELGSESNETENVSEDEPNKEGVVLEQDTSWKYGPETSRYILLDDWYKIRWGEHPMDTSLVNFQRYNYRDKNDFKYQYLGNLNSGMRPVWIDLPENIGNRVGITAYKNYWWNDNTIRYFNTLTPVTDWVGIIGGDGRSVIDATISQNITPWWNASIRFSRLTETELLGQQQISRRIFGQLHTGFMLTTRYETPNNRYKLAAHYLQQFHDGTETGGLATDKLLTDDLTYDDLFRLSRGALSNNLDDVTTIKKEYNWQLYHQYALLDTAKLQVFHKFKTSKELFRYLDDGSNNDFYVRFLTEDQDSTINYPELITHEIKFESIENQLGAKSRVGPLFLSAYGRYINYTARESQSALYEIPLHPDNQLFAGAEVAFLLPDSTSELSIKGETELLNTSSTTLTAALDSRYGKVAFYFNDYIQDELSQYFISPFFSWNNNFSNTTMTRYYIGPSLPLGKHGFISVFGEFTSIDNFLYYDQKSRPQQLDGTLEYYRYGGKFDLKFWYFRQIGEYIYTDNPNTDVFRTPEMFASYQLAFEKKLKQLTFMIGFDAHWRSAYYADAWNPIIQEFYLQDFQEIWDYPLLDVFINFRIRRTNVFLKMTNVLEGSYKEGYYDTPEYMGQRLGFEYGLRWMLFD
ncbi:putative porin [Limibacter armeniacum]|uniref:putative porin n=1 Tax=Limibacter armeniacum TaxID=466084 RepID=UPI002FE602A8